MAFWEAGFKEGDIIDFCDEQYIVLKNYGCSGKVQENCKNGNIIGNFYWQYVDEKCKLVLDGVDKRQ